MLVDQLGLDLGPTLRQLETDMLNQSPTLDAMTSPLTSRTLGLGPRTTVELARTLAIAGGDALVSSRRDRLAAALAAERHGDVALTARVIGAPMTSPAIWSPVDDVDQARSVVAITQRTLTALGPDGPANLRARLHATIAVESRGTDEAERWPRPRGTLCYSRRHPARLTIRSTSSAPAA